MSNTDNKTDEQHRQLNNKDFNCKKKEKKKKK
jgi:hypothetical protein